MGQIKLHKLLDGLAFGGPLVDIKKQWTCKRPVPSRHDGFPRRKDGTFAGINSDGLDSDSVRFQVREWDITQSKPAFGDLIHQEVIVFTRRVIATTGLGLTNDRFRKIVEGS